MCFPVIHIHMYLSIYLPIYLSMYTRRYLGVCKISRAMHKKLVIILVSVEKD